MRRFTTLLTALLLVMPLALPAPAAEGDTETPEFDPYDMVFPIDGDHSSSYDNHGDCRGSGCSRSHEGNDIMADKGTPVVAVGPGVVKWISSPSDTSSVYLGIDHGNGWFTRYLHLDNDSPDTDDGQFYGIAEGIALDTYVEKGQLIGWVGDSGNAEESGSHLHFELRENPNGGHGEDIDPNDYLLRAEGNWVGQFYDDDSSVHQDNIDKVFAAGITVGCNPPDSTEYCPGQSISRGQMAAFIARALGISEMSGETTFDDLEGHQFANAVDKIVTAGIGFGCDDDGTSFCPDDPLQRDEMAEMLVRAFDYEYPEGTEDTDFFDDDDGTPFEEAINKLRANDITVGCNPPDNNNFCPGENITRGQMATFFVRVGAA